jgi:hypothetical protein
MITADCPSVDLHTEGIWPRQAFCCKMTTFLKRMNIHMPIPGHGSPPQPRRWRGVAACLAIFILALGSARAVILFSTADPSANTTAPTGNLAGSGWQYQGVWGGNLGTPIAPNFFISAGHIGNAGNSVFTYQSVNYSVVNGFQDSFSDLVIWQISAAQTFPTFAPLYNTFDEVGQHLVVIGRGTLRGSDAIVNGTLRGWYWGSGGPQRWGENVVTSILTDPGLHELLYATFDANGLPHEAHLSAGDSGGAVFIQNQGVWKLAAINYGVDTGFYTDANGSNLLAPAALFDTRDLYYQDPGDPQNYILISGPDPVPTGFGSTRISTSIDWIYSVIDPNSDADANGVPNLLQYALTLNSPPEPGYGATTGAVSGGFVSITYRKITTATQLQYEVDQSTDLLSWTPASPQEQILETRGSVQTIKASVAVGLNTRMFLRLKITQATEAAKATSRRAAYKTGNAR